MIYYLAALQLFSQPAPLVIKDAVAGRQPSAVVDQSTTCSFTVPKDKHYMLLAAVDSPFPEHTSLQMKVQSSSLLLTPIAQILGSFHEGVYKDLKVEYIFAATVQAGVIPLQTKTVLITVLE